MIGCGARAPPGRLCRRAAPLGARRHPAAPTLKRTDQGCELTLKRTKGSQTEAVLVPLPYGKTELCPVHALACWLDAAAISDGPVFRRLWLPAHAAPDAPLPARRSAAPLTPRSIARIVQGRAAAAGFAGHEFGGHSLKRGALSTGMEAGAHAAQLKRLGRHKSRARRVSGIRQPVRRASPARTAVAVGVTDVRSARSTAPIRSMSRMIQAELPRPASPSGRARGGPVSGHQRFSCLRPPAQPAAAFASDTVTFSASRTALAGEKVSFLEAGMAMVSPVAGLRPDRAARSAALKRPKPARFTSSPARVAPVITASILSMTFRVLSLETPCSAAMRSTRSLVFNFIPPEQEFRISSGRPYRSGRYRAAGVGSAVSGIL